MTKTGFFFRNLIEISCQLNTGQDINILLFLNAIISVRRNTVLDSPPIYIFTSSHRITSHFCITSLVHFAVSREICCLKPSAPVWSLSLQHVSEPLAQTSRFKRQYYCVCLIIILYNNMPPPPPVELVYIQNICACARLCWAVVHVLQRCCASTNTCQHNN